MTRNNLEYRVIRIVADDAPIAIPADRPPARSRAAQRRRVTRGSVVPDTRRREQVIEVIKQYGPSWAKPFTRHPGGNRTLQAVSKTRVEGRVPAEMREQFADSRVCDACGHVAWRGSRGARVRQLVQRAQAGVRVA